jgi:hypothetical protein
MAEQIPQEQSDHVKEAKRIVCEYLSGLGWIRTQRNIAYRTVLPAVDREELEEKFREYVKREEEVEWKFGQEVDKWRKSDDFNRKSVLGEIVKALGNRRDLGFFGKRIVDRLKRELS